jgi:methionyl-tRNA synthetase
MQNYYSMMNGMPWLMIILAWSVVWKGLALYRAARREDKVWFVALLIIKTLGILEILYLYIFGKDKDKTLPAAKPPAAPIV